jgi:hypothetical protein
VCARSVEGVSGSQAPDQGDARSPAVASEVDMDLDEDVGHSGTVVGSMHTTSLPPAAEPALTEANSMSSIDSKATLGTHLLSDEGAARDCEDTALPEQLLKATDDCPSAAAMLVVRIEFHCLWHFVGTSTVCCFEFD